VPQLLSASLCEQIERIGRLKQQERELTRRIERHNAGDALATELMAVPGIGVLTASSLSAELTGGPGATPTGASLPRARASRRA
jgi:transposase